MITANFQDEFEKFLVELSNDTENKEIKKMNDEADSFIAKHCFMITPRHLAYFYDSYGGYRVLYGLTDEIRNQIRSQSIYLDIPFEWNDRTIDHVFSRFKQYFDEQFQKREMKNFIFSIVRETKQFVVQVSLTQEYAQELETKKLLNIKLEC
jgi:hypothetical protein